MKAGKSLSAAALLAIFAAAPHAVPQRSAPQPASAVCVPKGERLETLQDWERRPGARPPPEIVAGVYERDGERYDFGNRVAITIDDASPNASLERELDVLGKHGIKAVFFIVGSSFVSRGGRPLPRAKDLLDRIVEEGHQIGSHTFRHRRLDEGMYRDNRGAIVAELDRNQAAIDKALGYHYPILYVRPPNGAHASPRYAVDRALLAKGQYLANWTITSFDWNMRYKPGNPERLTAAQVIARTVKQAREESGGVVLFHGFETSALIFEDLINALASVGNGRGRLVFSTLDDIMMLKYGGSGSPR